MDSQTMINKLIEEQIEKQSNIIENAKRREQDRNKELDSILGDEEKKQEEPTIVDKRI